MRLATGSMKVIWVANYLSDHVASLSTVSSFLNSDATLLGTVSSIATAALLSTRKVEVPC